MLDPPKLAPNRGRHIGFIVIPCAYILPSVFHSFWLVVVLDPPRLAPQQYRHIQGVCLLPFHADTSFLLAQFSDSCGLVCSQCLSTLRVCPSRCGAPQALVLFILLNPIAHEARMHRVYWRYVHVTWRCVHVTWRYVHVTWRVIGQYTSLDIAAVYSCVDTTRICPMVIWLCAQAPFGARPGNTPASTLPQCVLWLPAGFWSRAHAQAR